MKKPLVLIAAFFFLSAAAPGVERDVCEVPSYLLFSDFSLDRVAEAVKTRRQLDILVLGSGSSALPGASAAGAYPKRLEALLGSRLPGVTVNVVSAAKSRQTAIDMEKDVDKLLLNTKPTLVIWQSGTVDAMQGIELEAFRSALDEGIEMMQARGVDVVLMNMQYSPRTEGMLSLSAYADNMRVVARDREVPLFDRLGIMRYWNDSGAFNLYAGSKDPAMALKVHDCIGRALASLVIEAAHLSPAAGKASQ
jgi:hypothetical protein